MAVTTGSAEPAEATTTNSEVEEKPKLEVETLSSITYSAIDQRNSYRAMTAALGDAAAFLPKMAAPVGERYAQAGDVINDGTVANGTPAAEISDAKKKELKDDYGVDVEIKDGKYRFTRQIDGVTREVFSSDPTEAGMDRAIKAIEKQEELKDKHGVDTFLENGKYKFTYKADGEIRDAIPPTDATPDALDKATTDLEAQTKAKVQELEKRFKISIAGPGEPVANEENLCTTNPNKTIGGEIDPTRPIISTRTPTMAELYALEQALKQSEPSQLPLPGEKPIKVMFLDKPLITDGTGQDIALGVYISPELNKGQGALLITAKGAEAPATDKDANEAIDSLAATIRHEIAHHGQRNLFPKMEVPDSVLKSMGWIKFPNPEYKSNEPGSQRFNYAIKTQDGKYYTNSQPSCANPQGEWREVNSKGQYLGADGKVVRNKEDAATIDTETLRDAAVVTPSTEYFTQPLEVLAEGMMRYRAGPEERNILKEDYPELFKVIEKVDELERKLRYGVDRNGRAKVQRREDGTLDR